MRDSGTDRTCVFDDNLDKRDIGADSVEMDMLLRELWNEGGAVFRHCIN